MELIKIGIMDADRIAPLVAAFRTQLKSYKGIESQPNTEAGKDEILEYLESGFPVYAVEDSGALVGYIVCRIDEPCLWVEHIFVQEDYRRDSGVNGRGYCLQLCTSEQRKHDPIPPRKRLYRSEYD